MKNSVIFQFDKDPKHISLKAVELYKENNAKIIDWPYSSSKLKSNIKYLGKYQN